MNVEGGAEAAAQEYYQCFRCACVMEKQDAAFGQIRSGKQKFMAALCRGCAPLFSTRSLFERIFKVVRGEGERPCHEKAPDLSVIR